MQKIGNFAFKLILTVVGHFKLDSPELVVLSFGCFDSSGLQEATTKGAAVVIPTTKVEVIKDCFFHNNLYSKLIPIYILRV